MGGYASIVWGLLTILLGGYEEFKLYNSLIGQVYPTMRSTYDADESSDRSKHEQDQLAQRAMLEAILSQGK